MNNYNEYYWADSRIDKISLDFDEATIYVYNETAEKDLIIHCKETVGISNLSLWDESYISYFKVTENIEDEFVLQLRSKHGKEKDEYRSVRPGLMLLEICAELNMKIYCYSIEVEEVCGM